jgi:SAM-dependent methyltransferase
VAREVTGLDIDESALVWAREAHGRSNLTFICRDDLGVSLPEASFDLITCFEMIEHVDLATQQKVIASLARLLKPDGLFLISTPNPDVTKLYGVNPYHVREMTEAELRDLVSPHFAHVSVLGQHVRAGVTFSQGGQSGILRPASMMPGERAEHPMAFIAICSRQPVRDVADTVFFDDGSNYIGDFIGREKKLQEARGEAYSQRAHAKSFEREYERYKHEYEVMVDQVTLITRMRDEDRQTYEEQLRSPRFLARSLWQAIKSRLRLKLSR